QKDSRDALVEKLRANNPTLRLAQVQSQKAAADRDLVAAERLPDFGVEFSYQSVEGLSPYYGGAIRLGLPISRWFGDPHADAAQAVQAARTYEVAAAERDLLGQLDSLLVLRKQTNDLLSHYRNALLPSARAARQTALRLYQQG